MAASNPKNAFWRLWQQAGDKYGTHESEIGLPAKRPAVPHLGQAERPAVLHLWPAERPAKKKLHMDLVSYILGLSISKYFFCFRQNGP